MSKKIISDTQSYRDLCKGGVDIPIFFQDWWLDCVCGAEHWESLCYYQDPNIVAIMPYHTKKQGFFKYVTMPVLTKFMGPYFIKQLSEKKKQSILMKMLSELPDFHGFTQTLHYQVTNWLPYRWEGFTQTNYYSYQLTDISNIEQTWQRIDADYRNNKMSKAISQTSIGEDLDFESFYDVTLQPFIRQGISCPYSKVQLHEIYKLVYRRQCGKCFYAKGNDGSVLAAVMIIWDKDRCYLLLAGENEMARNQGVGIYTIWKSIEYASQVLHLTTFDFLGGMAENLERTRRQFGADQIPYFLVERNTRFFSLVKSMSSRILGW